MKHDKSKFPVFINYCIQNKKKKVIKIKVLKIYLVKISFIEAERYFNGMFRGLHPRKPFSWPFGAKISKQIAQNDKEESEIVARNM